MPKRAGRNETMIRIALLAILYTGVAKLGLSLDAVSGFATLVWPSTGLALAALRLFGFRLWPGVFLGAWVVNAWTGAPVAVAFGIAVGNTLEAVLGTYALLRFAGSQGTFESLRQVLALILGAAALSTLVSTTVGVASLSLGGIVRSPYQAIDTWRAWWVGDVLGDLVVAPLLLTWFGRGEPVRLSAASWAEAAFLATLIGLASWAVFFRPSMPIYPFESPYILFPLFVWAALRFELRGATLATALASALAIWGTVRESGPFAREQLASGLLALQTFMGCAAITPLIVAGVSMDRARAVRSSETFLATVSHDLKNPLNSLLMSGESLVRKPPTQATIEKHHLLLKRSVDRMMRLITDLLDAAAIEQGRLTIDLRTEDSRALVSEVVDLMRPLASAKSLDLRVQQVDSIDVVCDRGRVVQVLSNAIGNSIKFCAAQSSITVQVKRIEEGACFSVQDTGPGIAVGDLPHVFERYWRAKSAAGGGSGLGLFIARGIVEAHRGRIWMESKLGSGCTLRFTLPVKAEPSQRTLATRLFHPRLRH